MSPRPSNEDPVAPRARVLATALQCFAARGYFNTTIPDIVRHSGVSTGALYHHFGDKEGIARALYDTLLERMGAALDAIEVRHTGARERCRAVVAHLFDQAEAEPEAVRFMLSSRHQEFMPELAPVCSSRPFVQMSRMVERGMTEGVMRRMDPVVAAAALFGGPLRLIQLRLDGLVEQPLPTLLEESWACAWRAVRAD